MSIIIVNQETETGLFTVYVNGELKFLFLNQEDALCYIHAEYGI